MNEELYLEELYRLGGLYEGDAREIAAVLQNPAMKRALSLVMDEISGKQRQLESVDFSVIDGPLKAAKLQGILVGMRRHLEILLEAAKEVEDSSEAELLPFKQETMNAP